MMMLQPLYGKSLEELKQLAAEHQLPAYNAGQIADWLYKKNVASIDGMTNLSKAFRDTLKENYSIGLVPHSKVDISNDGTKKYLFPALTGKFIEAAYIPEEKRNTLCVSSQVGCKMGCLFCMTGKQGFQGNLSVTEILNQLRSLPEREEVTNMVYMGMGEPFDNIEAVLKSLAILTSEYGFGWSPKRITVSTIGVIPGIIRFLEESRCHLAISLHSPFDEERRKLMPVQHVYPIQDVIKLLKKFDFSGQRRVSFEYIMFKDINDGVQHVNGLARLLNGIQCRINLIRYHAIPGTPLQSSTDETISMFRERLTQKGIFTSVRSSRGQDINAACGLLSTKEILKNQQEQTDF
jgi:23S rRNA (adenine2503-C2)-methyltransferase